MTEQIVKPKVNFLNGKQAVPEPFEWVAFINIGILSRETYDSLGYAGATPIHVVGVDNDIILPTHRISGESLLDVKEAMILGVNQLFKSVEKTLEENKKRIYEDDRSMPEG